MAEVIQVNVAFHLREKVHGDSGAYAVFLAQLAPDVRTVWIHHVKKACSAVRAHRRSSSTLALTMTDHQKCGRTSFRPPLTYRKPSTQLQVEQTGQAIADLWLPVADAAPAVLTRDGSGVGQGAILTENSTVNSTNNPAAKGSIVVVFATGAARTDPPGDDGKLAAEAFLSR